MQREVKVDRLKIEALGDKTRLDLSHALNCEMDADGTRYSLLVIPFEGYLGCGFISQSNAYLVIDGGEKAAYAFLEDPHYTYVYEKLIRAYNDPELRRQGVGERDAINTAHLISLAQAEIVKRQAETQRKAHEEGVLYHFGEGRLEEEEEEHEEDDGEEEDEVDK